MSNKYFPANDGSADELWDVVHDLPAGISDAFHLVAASLGQADAAAALRDALGQVRATNTRAHLPRVASHEILPLSLRLAGFLRRHDGWRREALAALAAAATARRVEEGRGALLVAADAIERGVTEVESRASAA